MGLWWAQPTSWSNKIIFIQWTDFTQCAGKFSHHNGCFFICCTHFISISRSLYSAFRSHLESAGWFFPHIQKKMGLSYRAPDSIRAGRLGFVTFPYLHDNKMYARCENCTHTSCMKTRRVWVMWEMCVCVSFYGLKARQLHYLFISRKTPIFFWRFCSIFDSSFVEFGRAAAKFIIIVVIIVVLDDFQENS